VAPSTQHPVPPEVLTRIGDDISGVRLIGELRVVHRAVVDVMERLLELEGM
jgi:hypothetical protein